MKNLLLIIFILSNIGNISGQDDSRLGVNLGYGTKLFSHEVFGIQNDHSLIKIGIEKGVRFHKNGGFFFGGELSFANVKVPSYRNGIFGPIVPAFEDNIMIAGIYGGVKNEYFDGLFYTSIGILLEYDIGGTDAFAYARQNGIGLFMLLGKDIHLSDIYVISLEPGIRVRSGFQFNGNNGTTGDSNHSAILDFHFNIGFAYKVF
ncbi:MAG: hypothetical protein ACI86M_000343 [Saprospiraceae bacterium]|jgi:hypothetical protein